MMPYNIFAEIAPGQTRVGFFDRAGIIQHVWLCRDDQPDLIGSVHQARIEQVFASQNRAQGRLADGTVISIRLPKNPPSAIAAGAVVVVTIVAAPRHGKAWQAVLDARLVTATLVLLPGQSSITISRRCGDAAAMRALAADLQVPDGFGVIVRRQATGIARAQLQASIDDLVTDWQASRASCDPAMPARLYDGGDLSQRACRFVPRASYHKCNIGDAQSAAIDAAISAAIQPEVQLPSGGRLWCQRTHALWAIDIDGAGADIQKYGFDGLFGEAAVEIARQIRLRGMSGPILIDVPRAGSANKKFRSQLQNCLDDDPQNPEILGMTRGGMLELSRPHGRAALDDMMADDVAQAALAGLRLAAMRPAFKPVHLAVNAAMAGWLAGAGKAAVAALNRPLEIEICLDDDQAAVAYIIDKVTATH
ncbi:MAG: ribonuclease E/G [Candidatus Puniceispirillaceae bacterium]